jgi:hypothetical protein
MGNLFGGTPAKSEAQVKAEKHQSSEIDRLTRKEESQRGAMRRRKRGRASLISNDERGVTSTLGG